MLHRSVDLRGVFTSKDKTHSGIIDPAGEAILNGNIPSQSELVGKLKNNSETLKGQIDQQTEYLEASLPGTLSFHYSDAEIPEYEGPYDVTPTVNSQRLKTADKVMRSDVEIDGVPYFETSNTAGGSTVYIAKELT